MLALAKQWKTNKIEKIFSLYLKRRKPPHLRRGRFSSHKQKIVLRLFFHTEHYMGQTNSRRSSHLGAFKTCSVPFPL